MISEVTISDFGIIDDVKLHFQEGLNVITGETGAGKSLIIDALDFLLGARADSESIRDGREFASISMTFELKDNLNKIALFEDDEVEDTIFIKRIYGKNKKNLCKVNGTPAGIGFLKKVRNLLVDIHSQHQHQLLLDEAYQLKIIDEMGDNYFQNFKGELNLLFDDIVSLKEKIEKIKKTNDDIQRNREFYKFVLNEIDDACLKEGEEEDIIKKKILLQNSEKIKNDLSSACALLSYDEMPVVDSLGKVSTLLGRLAPYAKEYEEISVFFNEHCLQISEISRELNIKLEQIAFLPDDLEKIQLRLYQISDLKRKYGKSVNDVLKYRNDIKTKLDILYDDNSLQKNLNEELAKKVVKWKEGAEELSRKRKIIIDKLKIDVENELEEIGLEKVKFEIRLEDKRTFYDDSHSVLPENSLIYKDGKDIVSFIISTNPGEPLRPISKVASGGELSRIMLAIKSVFMKQQNLATIILDEIDAGLGGKAAFRVAEKIKKISKECQVICITHLPMIAACSDTHFHIYKTEENARTVVKIMKLDEQGERVEEISRMLAGRNITSTTRKQAKEMLAIKY